MKPIIEVKNISKQYKIGQKKRYLSLRDSVSDFFTFKGRNTEGSDFWALDDVSFDVQAGESIGIIGRNGAGKSTLLKILSRITPPTKGSVILRGRIASLLEVGTGFHQELSGRENVFMNGSILGLRRTEIAQKFDEIVAFSGVEQFIDTPLKHYSSGMQLRLAFAVAAHLEPEILVIDEILAVGDAEFQKKCLGKMDEVSRSGRTIIFVSHNLEMLQNLCKRGIVLNDGQMVFDGSMPESLSFYDNLFEKKQHISRLPLKIDQYLTISELSFSFSIKTTSIFLQLQFDKKPKILDACLVIYSLSGIRLALIDLRPKFSEIAFSEKQATWSIETAPINLVNGTYSVGIYIVTPFYQNTEYDVIYLKVENDNPYPIILPYPTEYRGFWEIEVL